MNSIVNHVTHKTKGIICFPKDDFGRETETYKAIDYLSNGILTAISKENTDINSNIIVADHFNDKIYIGLFKKLTSNEIENYLKVFNQELTPEDELLIIDEQNLFEDIKKKIPKNLIQNCRLLKN